MPTLSATPVEALSKRVADKTAELRALSRSDRRLETALADELSTTTEVATSAGDDPVPTSGGGEDDRDFHRALRRAFVPPNGHPC